MTFDESLDELLENGDRVRELCEMVLANAKDRSTFQGGLELANAAPLLAKMLLKAIECLKRANTEDDDKLSYEFDQIANGDMWWKTRLSLFLMQSSGVTGLPEMWVGLKTT